MVGMKKKLKIIIWAIIIVVIFLPGFSKLQEIRSKTEKLERDIACLREENFALQEEIGRLNNDPVYLESVAREKMGLARKGEVVYKIVPEE
jgi:cell division protein FtsB